MSKSTPGARSGRAPGRSGRRAQGTTAVEVFTRPGSSIPALVALSLWRWRWELAALGAVLYVYHWIHEQHLSSAELVLLGEIPLVILLVPVTRRFVCNRVLCVFTRHRLRACLGEVRAMNHSGNLPFLVSARSTKVGESVWLLLRPGLSIEELANRREHVASACGAREARIIRSRRLACLVRVDVIRRDPLSGRSIASPLMAFRKTKGGPGNGTGPIPAQPPVGTAPATALRSTLNGAPLDATTSTADPAPTPAGPARLRNRTDPASPSTTAPGPPVVLGLNGEDITDYV